MNLVQLAHNLLHDHRGKLQSRGQGAPLAAMGQGQAKEDADDAPTNLVVRLPKENNGGRRHVVMQVLRCFLSLAPCSSEISGWGVSVERFVGLGRLSSAGPERTPLWRRCSFPVCVLGSKY